MHRGYQVQHFAQLGVQGIVSPDIGYLTGVQPPLTADVWEEGAISPGELTLDPYMDKYGLHWEEEGVIGLGVPDRTAFVSLRPVLPRRCQVVPACLRRGLRSNALRPLASPLGCVGACRRSLLRAPLGKLRWVPRPVAPDGRMAIYAHIEGNPNGQLLTATQQGRPFKSGLWSDRLDVTPATIRMTRYDGSFVEARDDRFRGGYVHIGRSGPTECSRSATSRFPDQFSGTTRKSAMLATTGALVAEPDR